MVVTRGVLGVLELGTVEKVCLGRDGNDGDGSFGEFGRGIICITIV